MKTFKTVSIVFILSIISQSVTAVSATFKGDTIRYKFDKVLVEVTSPNFVSNSPERLQLGERVSQVQKILNEMTIEKPSEGERVMIAVRDVGNDLLEGNFKILELRNEKMNSKDLVIFDDGTIFEKDFGRYCISLNYHDLIMKLYLDNLSDLSYFSSDLFMQKAKSGTESIQKEIGQHRKYPVQAWVDLRAGTPEVFIQDSGDKPLDMLLISGGIGAGWVRNTFVSDLNFRLGLGFVNRGMMKNIYSVDWSIMYDFTNSSDENYFDLNHFVSLGWEHNFSNSPLEEKWYGLSLGYLVKQNNHFFKENTFRLSMNKKINNTFSVKPELYFNDFFKNIYPGIRLSVAF
ncbi:hypothetical protein [Maribellus mangrovi]|uniref:hypothetical protein n=1 Tax=Maribellus mangrovi TaxID=3133146 RepID=UPI0030EC201A